MTLKSLPTILLMLFLSDVVLSQQQLCRLELVDGQKYILYSDGSLKYDVGSKPINPSGVITPITTPKCGAKVGEQIWLMPNGVWKHLPNPDLSRIENKSFDEATSDRVSIVDKVVRVDGTLRDADWFWGWFKDKEATHLSFRLTSKASNRKVYLYFPSSEKATQLREKMKANGNSLDGHFDIWFSTLSYESTKANAGEIYAELLDYHSVTSQPRSENIKKPSVEVGLEKPSPTPRVTEPVKTGFIYQDMITDDNHSDWSPIPFPETRDLGGMELHGWVYDRKSTENGLLTRAFATKWVDVFVRMTKNENGTQSYILLTANCTDKKVMMEVVGIKYGNTKRFQVQSNSQYGVPSGLLRVSKNDVPEYNLLQWGCTKAGFWK